MAATLKASESGLRSVDLARSKKGWNKADYAWCDAAHISVATLKRFWQGQPILQDSFIAICEAVGCNWEEIIEESGVGEAALDRVGATEQETDWKDCCRRMLASQKALTTNQITTKDGITFEVQEPIYVAMDLIKVKQQRKLDTSKRYSPEQGSQLYQPEAVKENDKLEQNEFLELFDEVLVLSSEELSQKQPQRIAILGEPGAGKSTLLQKVAFSVLDKTHCLPIWISFGDLKDKSMEDYLLDNWLKAALLYRNIAEAVKDNFVEQFTKNKVLLLLDGLDEINDEPVKILQSVAQWLTGWVGEAAVVLTCRFNVWHESKNYLVDFDSYQVSGFQSEQIKQFITNWFQNYKKKELEELKQNLTEKSDYILDPQWQRLQDMAQNPLRLAMLCYIWQQQHKFPDTKQQQQKFPDTKLALYRQLVEAMYQWKKERFTIGSEDRKTLDNNLAALALWGIEKGKFVFPSAPIHQFLPNNYLLLSLQIGLINQVGTEAYSTNEKVYAFFHPALQEYFAASAISQDEKKDWQYFVNLEKEPISNLKPQWTEVFLIWNEGINDSIKQRKNLIYLINELMELVISKQDEEAKRATANLKKLLYSCESDIRQNVVQALRMNWLIYHNLEKIDNEYCVDVFLHLLNLLKQNPEDRILLELVWSLSHVGSKNKNAKEALNKIKSNINLYSNDELEQKLMVEEIRRSLEFMDYSL